MHTTYTAYNNYTTVTQSKHCEEAIGEDEDKCTNASDSLVCFTQNVLCYVYQIFNQEISLRNYIILGLSPEAVLSVLLCGHVLTKVFNVKPV